MIPRFFGVHQAVMRTGLWARMRPGEQSLYVTLMHESERRSTRQFKLKDGDVGRIYGIAPRTLCNARKKLQELGLILYLSSSGNVYTYTICDPETGSPYPGEPNKRVPYIKKADHEVGGASFISMPAVPSTEPPKKDLPPEAYGRPGVFDTQSSWRR